LALGFASTKNADGASWDVNVTGTYGFRNFWNVYPLGFPGTMDRLAWDASVGLSVSIVLPSDLRIDAQVSAAFANDSSPEVPFGVSLVAPLGTMASFGLHGGRRVTRPDLRELRRDIPWLVPRSDLEPLREWAAGAEFTLRPRKDVSVNAGLDWSFADASIGPALVADAATGLVDVVRPGVVALDPRLEAAFRFDNGVAIGAGWTWRAMQRVESVPPHRFEFSAGISDERFPFGGKAVLDWPWYYDRSPEPPRVDLEGFARLSDTVRFSLSADDVFSPLLKNGRTGIAGYLEPGIRVSLVAHISL
jgi:hypothetical protein